MNDDETLDPLIRGFADLISRRIYKVVFRAKKDSTCTEKISAAEINNCKYYLN
jgi:hypothetical protein